MNILSILGVLCLLGSGAMYYIGDTNGALTELKDTFFLPILPGLLLLYLGNKKKNQTKE
jgi:hypothetical protein